METMPQTDSMPGVAAATGTSLAERRTDSVRPLNLWNLLKALRQRWLPATVVGLLFAGTVVTVLWFVLPPPKQTARSLLRVLSFEPQVLSAVRADSNPELFQRSQIALAKSRFVINAALKDPEVAKLPWILEHADPHAWLEKEIQADFWISPETMRISMKGHKPEQMKVIVNAITKAYLKEIVNKRKNEQLDRLEQLKRTFTRFDEQIQEKKRQLQQLVLLAGTGNSDLLYFQQQLLRQQAGSLQNEIIALQAERRKLTVKIASETAPMRRAEEMALCLYGLPSTESQIPFAIAALIRSRIVEEARLAQALKGKVEELIQTDTDFRKYMEREVHAHKVEEALKKVSPDPEVAKTRAKILSAELASIRDSVEARRKELRPKLLRKLQDEARINSSSNLIKYQTEYNYLIEMEKEIEKQVGELFKERKVVERNSLDLDTLKDDIARKETYWKKTQEEIERIDVEQQAPARITPLEDAIIYRGEASASRYSMLGLGGVGSFALILLGFGLWEFWCHRVSTPSEVTDHTGMRLVGTLPDYKRLPAPDSQTRERYDSPFSDSVDAVRTRLLFMSKMEGVRTVLVTSASAGEGKTSSACHLAASLVRAGRKTLLVDCDLRNPMAHELFQMDRSPGFSELLRGQAELDLVIRPTAIDGLHFLAAGQCDSESLQTLAMERTAELFKRLKERFEFIVVDSAPILPVPDTLLIAQHTDAAVFAILRNVSRLPKIQAAYTRMNDLGVRILGAIFNGGREESHYYGYGYGYGYGYPRSSQT